MPYFLLGGRTPEVEDHSVQTRHRFACRLAELPRDPRISFREGLEPGARVTCHDSIFGYGFDHEMVSAAGTKAKDIARQQQVDNLPLTIDPGRKAACNTGLDPVPALHRIEFSIDLLAASIGCTNGEEIQPAQSAFGGCITLVGPDRLADPDTQRIPNDHALTPGAIHRLPSAVTIRAEWRSAGGWEIWENYVT